MKFSATPVHGLGAEGEMNETEQIDQELTADDVDADVVPDDGQAVTKRTNLSAGVLGQEPIDGMEDRERGASLGR
jgi:hypothetical protein